MADPAKLNEILDDANPQKLIDFMNTYSDPTRAEDTRAWVDDFVRSRPDKFFLKLASIINSDADVKTRLGMVTHFHNFLIKNKSCLDGDTDTNIKEILLEVVKREVGDEMLEYLCNLIADFASPPSVWPGLVEFIGKSLDIIPRDGEDIINPNVCLDIVAKEPKVLMQQHEGLSKALGHFLSCEDSDTRILALKAAIQVIGCPETKNRNPYKKLLPRLIPVLQIIAKEPGPRAQRSIVGTNQKLVDRYVDAKKLFETLVNMNDVGFFITEGQHLTSFIKCLLNIGGTKLCWVHMRYWCLRLAANFKSAWR